MDVINTILSSIKTFKSLSNFIEGGGVESILGDIELEAARKSMEKIKMAADKRGQAWITISHLQSAHVAYIEGLKKRELFGSANWTKMKKQRQLFYKGIICLCLMSVFYKYLGDIKLCRAQIDESLVLLDGKEIRDFNQYVKTGQPKRGILMLSIINIPIFIGDRLVNSNAVEIEEIKREDILKLLSILESI